MGITFSRGGIVLFLIFTLGAVSEASFRPSKIEAYGDSLTAAFLANTNVTNAPSSSEVSAIYTDLANFKIKNDRRLLERHEPRHLSWVAELTSLLFPQDNIPIINVAVTGAKSWQLPGEIQAVGPQENTAAFIFIGHNDFCEPDSSPEAMAKTYRGELDKALTIWEANHKNSTMHLVPIGEIYRVYQTLKGYVWHKATDNNFSCEDSWRKLFPWCPAHYRKFANGTLEKEMAPKMEAMDAELEKIVENATSTKGNKYRYLKGVQKVDYEPYAFAVDCFHLSAEGQKAFGKSVSNAVFLD